MADEFDTPNDDLSEPERYDSAENWQPPPEKRHLKKLVADYRKKHASELNRHETMFTGKQARRWQQDREARNKPRRELYGPMWRQGELAVLCGEPGSGMSILAVQIAETIARGVGGRLETGDLRRETVSTNSPVSRLQSRVSQPPAHPVLYLDLQHTGAQFDERYSCPSPIPGKLPIRYRFAPKLERKSFGDLEIPDAFDNDFTRYFEHSIKVTIETTNAKVIVIDNLSWFDSGMTRSQAALIRWMRNLKFYCIQTGTSILVLHSISTPQRPGRPPNSPPCLGGVAAALGGRGGSSGLRPLSIPNSALRIYEHADSVFAIAHSTFAPDIRYVKPLKSAAPLVRTGSVSDWGLQPGEVLTYQIQRSTGFQKSSPPYEGGVALASSDEVVLSPSTPFLGLNYLGPSNEIDHLRNYAAEALAQQHAQERELKRLARRSSKAILVDAMIDGSYGRYLKDE